MGQSPSPQDPMPQAPRAGQAWPDGWYVYEAGRLNGPFTAAETFRRDPEPDAAGKPLLVSRKGFSQWYPLRDLAEIYRASDGAVAPVPPSTRPKVMAKKVGVGAAPHVPAPAHARPSPAAAKAAPVSAQRALSGPSVSAFKTSASAADEPPVSASHAKKAVLQEYFLARTRLRLGKVRNPWTTALVGFPVFWPFWLVAVQKEMVFHTHPVGAAKKETPWAAVLAIVPVLHMFMAFRLAKDVRAMEAQNKYQYTRPWLAAVLAVFPPFAMGYLQHAMNRHWMLHAKHLVVKRRARAA